MGSVTRIHNHDCYIVTYKLRIRSFTHIASYILELLGVGSTAAYASILAPFSKQTESFPSPHEIGRFTASHWWLCLAVFFIAWLAQISLLITGPTRTLINHIDTHHGWNNYVQCYINGHIHSQLFYILRLNTRTIGIHDYTFTHLNFILASWKGLLGQHSSVRHTSADCSSSLAWWDSQYLLEHNWRILAPLWEIFVIFF
jgi:hypothetical protein